MVQPRSLFSASWYRVVGLKPRLRSHLRTYRQSFRGEIWHVLEDRQAGQYHRLSQAGYLMLSLMDGRRTMQEIWEAAGRRLGKDQPTQDEAIHLLTQLHFADLLSSDVTPDLAQLDTRGHRARMQQMISRIRNPLALRFPLLDPDRFLERTLWAVRWVFTPFGFVAWLALTIAGAVLAIQHWSELTSNLSDRVLAAGNLALLALVYPIMKGLHELGHGYAVKRWGGEVHEMGIMLLVLMPVPYVDASASLGFAEKMRRVVVGAAGIMVELALAALAVIVWLNVEDGWVRAGAFNVMLIGGVSTLFFNGNPLLRFDGYYVLCDLIESPNLGTRSNRYFFYIIQRYAFGLIEVEPPVSAHGEKFWLLCYALASFVYRMFVMLGIALFIATKFFFIGAVLAIWSIASLILFPLLKGARFLLVSRKLRHRRPRALAATAVALAALGVVLFIAPVPYATVVQGVVLSPPGTQLLVGTDGRIEEMMAEPGSLVEAGTPVLRMFNPEQDGRLSVLEAERREFLARLAATLPSDRVSSRLVRLRIEAIDAEIASTRERIEALTLLAPATGRLVLHREEILEGRWLPRGHQLGFVVPVADPVIRAVADQNDIDLIRSRTKRVDIRLAHELERLRPARVAVVSPSAIGALPSRALAWSGGGDIAVQPADPEGTTPLRDVFEVDIRLIDPAVEAPVGQRAYVRFDHGDEPLFWRLWRGLRQLLLRTLDV